MPTGIIIVIISGVIAGLFLFLYMCCEARSLSVETIVLDGKTVDGAGTSAVQENAAFGLRALHLSDIHIRYMKVPFDKIVKAVLDTRPDVIFLTGDYIEKRDDIPPFLDWLAKLGTIQNSETPTPIYLCYGNHDLRVYKKEKRSGLSELTKLLKKQGIFVLDNRSVVLVHKGNRYGITGFSDLTKYPFQPEKALAGCDKSARYHIGLAHNPDTVLRLRPAAVDILLSGHFHGGQIWMPFHLEYRCLRREKLCKQGVYQGLHNINGVQIYISRGLGCVLFPLRFCSKPQVTLLLLP